MVFIEDNAPFEQYVFFQKQRKKSKDAEYKKILWKKNIKDNFDVFISLFLTYFLLSHIQGDRMPDYISTDA